MPRGRSAARSGERRPPGPARARRSRSSGSGERWKISVLAEVGDAPARREDVTREGREWAESRVAARRAQGAALEIEGDLVAVARELDRFRGFESWNAEVDAVAEEDPREGLRDDPADPELRERRNRVLARASAAEILSADEDVPRPDLFREAGARVAERIRVELVLT